MDEQQSKFPVSKFSSEMNLTALQPGNDEMKRIAEKRQSLSLSESMVESPGMTIEIINNDEKVVRRHNPSIISNQTLNQKQTSNAGQGINLNSMRESDFKPAQRASHQSLRMSADESKL